MTLFGGDQSSQLCPHFAGNVNICLHASFCCICTQLLIQVVMSMYQEFPHFVIFFGHQLNGSRDIVHWSIWLCASSRQRHGCTRANSVKFAGEGSFDAAGNGRTEVGFSDGKDELSEGEKQEQSV